jgi:phosphomannomutase
MLLENNSSTNNPTKQEFDDSTTTIVVGQDPRLHGRRLIDAFARGAESRHASVKVVYTGIATTPACSAFCRILRLADAGVMVTASHLPADKNGFKLFTTLGGQVDIQELGRRAADQAAALYSSASLPATSGHDSVMCSAWVDWMPMYAASLEQAVCTLVDTAKSPLEGLTIVLNAGNGSGGFFRTVLESLGANVSYCIHCEPDGNFFHGVPNPESPAMVEATIQQCVEAQADLGIMLDTDADRCGFIVPASKTDNSNERLTTADYEPLNRNRLIALLAVVFARTSPGCAVVTDSVTSEGLATFLYQLGLTHVRYLKGYANVIAKAKELTESGLYKAELAIETSGHCAMMENDYLDDGTYTAVTVVSLLARERASGTATGLLLDLIRDLEELEEIAELRMTVADESLDTMLKVFDFLALRIETLCESIPAWEIDTKNLEGVRVRTGNSGFLMLRKSLHDPIISLQIEGSSKEQVRRVVMEPLLQLCESEEQIKTALDTSVLREY